MTKSFERGIGGPFDTKGECLMVFVGDLAPDDMRIREYLECVRNSLLDTAMVKAGGLTRREMLRSGVYPYWRAGWRKASIPRRMGRGDITGSILLTSLVDATTMLSEYICMVAEPYTPYNRPFFCLLTSAKIV